MRYYRTPNGRMIPRGHNGRFKKVYLTDFYGDEVNSGKKYICKNCGYGKEEYWMPLMVTGICPKCGSQEKEIKE